MTIRIEKPEFLFREQLNAIDSNIPVSKMPNGSVIQVATRHRQSGTYVSTNQSNYVDVTDLSVPITPKHHGSMIMIIVNPCVAQPAVPRGPRAVVRDLAHVSQSMNVHLSAKI